MKRYSIKGHYKMKDFAGCEGDLIISYNSYVRKRFRNKGLGQKWHKKRIQKAKKKGYSCMICTSVKGNKKQTHILKSNSWMPLFQFYNKNTGHDIIIWIKDI